MRSLIVLLATLLTIPTLQAQVKSTDFSVSYGALFERKATPDVENIFKANDQYVVVRKEPIKGPGGYRYFVELYNNDLQFEKEIQLKNSNEKREFRVEIVFKVEENIAVLYSLVDKKEDKAYFFVDLIDSETLEPSRRDLFSFPREHYKEYHKIEIESSPNNEYFLISYIEGSYYAPKIQFVLFYDSQFEMISNMSQAFAEYKKDIKLYETLIGNDGKVYFTIKEKLETQITYGDNIEKYGDYRILILDGEQFEEVKFETGDLHISYVRLRNSPQGGVGGCALYNNYAGTDDKPHLMDWNKGLFTFQIDKERGELNFSEVHPFNVKFLTENRTEDELKMVAKFYKYQNLKDISEQVAAGQEVDKTENFEVGDDLDQKNLVGFRGIKIHDVIIDDKNNVYVVMQENSFNKSSFSDGHILCSKFSGDGKHLWDAKVPYFNAHALYTFYKVVRTAEGVSILYADHEANIQGKNIGPRQEWNYTWSHIVAANFNSSTPSVESVIDLNVKKGFESHDYKFPTIDGKREVVLITNDKVDGFQLVKIQEN